MNPTTNTEAGAVADVAANLTVAQREVIMKLRPAGGRQRAVNFSGSTAAALRLPNSRRGALTDRDMTRKNGLKTAWYFLTPLGLAVRQHLEQGRRRVNNELINAALSGQFPIEEMGPHFIKYHLPDGRVIHRFTADDGGAIHDHPWSFTTEILRGGYVEQIWTHGPSQYHSGNQWHCDTHYRRESEARYVPAATIHTITSLIGDECWTLVTPEPWKRQSRFYGHDPETGIFVSRQWDEGWECSKTA